MAADPTKTAALRKRFAAEVTRRFGRVRKAVKQAVVADDVFNLVPLIAVHKDGDKPGRKGFAGMTDAKKVEEFARWLEALVDAEILGITQQGDRQGTWANTYVDAAYKRGIEGADGQLKKAGVEIPGRSFGLKFGGPVHTSALELIYARTYEDLRGVTRTMAGQMTRELAQGFAEGLGPIEIARNMNARVDAIGVTRARTIARTEVIRAHAEGTLNEFAAFEIEGVTLGVEFHTASDPCPVCEGLRDSLGVLTVDESRGIIPVHPNCRCVWLPVVEAPALKANRRRDVGALVSAARAHWKHHHTIA